MAWTAGSVTMLTAIDKQNIKEGSTEIAWNEKNKYNKLNVKYVFRAKKWRQSADRGFVTGFCNIDRESESVQHSPLVNRNETTGIGHFYRHVRWIFADGAKNDIPK